jgi:hypothetical protein
VGRGERRGSWYGSTESGEEGGVVGEDVSRIGREEKGAVMSMSYLSQLGD